MRLLPMGPRRSGRAIPGLCGRHAVAARSSARTPCRHRLAPRAPGLGSGLCHRGCESILAGRLRAGEFEKSARYTSADNVRSQAGIKRLNMQRAATLDYSEPLGKGAWHGLMWMVRRGDLVDLDHSDDRAR